MKMFISLVAILIFLILPLSSQVQQQWVNLYNGPADSLDIAYVIFVDASSNVYVTGQSQINGAFKIYTIKYNSSGIQQWSASYVGTFNGTARPYGMTVDDLGNVYVTGTASYSNTAIDMVTIKYNSSGVQQWAARYDGASCPSGISVGVDNSGNVYATGGTDLCQPTCDMVTIKYNSSGVQQWAIVYNESGASRPSEIAVDGSGNSYITGWRAATPTDTNSDFVTLNYNSSGVQQWLMTYNNSGRPDQSNSIALDGSGNVYITGSSFGVTTEEDYETIKYNSSGVLQWAKRYDSPLHYSDIAKRIKLDGSGNVYVTGSSFTGTEDYCTIKYNNSGVQQWVANYQNGIPYDLAVDNLGNAYITGYGTGGSSQDYLTVKYNSLGVQQWFISYNGTASSTDIAYSIALDASGNVYVTGSSNASNSWEDYATIKYSQTIGIQPISNEIPNQISLSQNYPNPFNPNTAIRFSLSVAGMTNLKVYDILGREVATLVNEQLKAGIYKVKWNADNYTSGIYYYKLFTDSYAETRKMILIK